MFKRLVFFLILQVLVGWFFTLKCQTTEKSEVNRDFASLRKDIERKSNNAVYTQKLIENYIIKAKYIGDNDELYNGYSLGMSYANGRNKILYGDSTIMVAMKSQDKRYIGLAYAGLANINYKLNDYKKSLEAALIADQYLQNEKSKEYAYESRFTIAKLKYIVGDYEESRRIITEVYEYFKWKVAQKPVVDIQNAYISSLVILMKNNSALERFNENDLYIKEGDHFLQQSPLVNRASFTAAKALNHYYMKKYDDAISGFNKAIALYKDAEVHYYEMFYLGMSYWKQHNYEQANIYFENLLHYYDSEGRMSLEFRPMFEFYIEYYKKLGDKDKQLVAVDKLLVYDRDIYSSQNDIDKRLRKEYDDKRLVNERLSLESYHSKEKWSLIGIFISLIIGCVSWFIYTKSKMRFRERSAVADSEEVIEEHNFGVNEAKAPLVDIESKSTDTNTIVDYNMYQPINKQTVKLILKNIEDFEKKGSYLKPDIKIGRLAEQFNTNEKYISKIIKVKTGKNFNQYINDLRFAYMDRQMKINPEFKDQKIKTISFALGFGTPELFAKLFKEKYNSSPSEYFSK